MTHFLTIILRVQGQHVRKFLSCILLFLAMGVVMGQRSVRNKTECSKEEYWIEGLCCNKCAEGHKLIKKCSSGMPTECAKCSEGTYQDKMNYFPNCFRCQKCSKSSHAVAISQCTFKKNTVCGCQPGYRKIDLDILSWTCVPPKKRNYRPCDLGDNSDQETNVINAS